MSDLPKGMIGSCPHCVAKEIEYVEGVENLNPYTSLAPLESYRVGVDIPGEYNSSWITLYLDAEYCTNCGYREIKFRDISLIQEFSSAAVYQ